jgi:AAA domain (dynein-related subfamily)
MFRRHVPPDPAQTRQRIAAQLVGRAHELEPLLSAVAAGRDIVLERPPGTSKTTMVKAITSEWEIPLVLVEGNAKLTPAKLIGHNSAHVLHADDSAENFVPGPLITAMRDSGSLDIVNRTQVRADVSQPQPAPSSRTHGYFRSAPQSTGTLMPVTNRACSEASHSTASVMSSGATQGSG